jgi:hypothetical protein
MFVHLGHLGHLTPKTQQNRPFFNLSKMSNNKFLGRLARPRTPALRTSASPAVKNHHPRRGMDAEIPMWQEPRIGNSRPPSRAAPVSCLLPPVSSPKKNVLILSILIILPHLQLRPYMLVRSLLDSQGRPAL